MSTFGGPSKRIVNAYLAHVARGKVLVLDTRALGTSRAMAETVGKRKIVAFGTDPKLEKRCKKFGIKCEKGWSGDVLAKLQKQKQLFDIIYLDYCGTPDGNDMFDPMEDMARASTMLTRGGILACTFCKRSSQVMSKCINMTPPTLSLQRSFEYCDTSAMVFVVYSARKLPMIGPPVGSVVTIKYKRMPFRVVTLYLDGMKVQAVKKKGTEWVDDKSYEELDDVLFDEIKEVIARAPYKKIKSTKGPKTSGKVNALDLGTFIDLMKGNDSDSESEPLDAEPALAAEPAAEPALDAEPVEAKESKPVSFASYLRRKQMHAAKQRKSQGKTTSSQPVAATLDLTGLDITVPLPKPNVTLRMMPSAKTSVEWLAGAAVDWQHTRVKQMCEKHVAMRWRASDYDIWYDFSTKSTAKSSIFTCGADLIALSQANKWEPWISIIPDRNLGKCTPVGEATIGVYSCRKFAPNDIVTRHVDDSVRNSLRDWPNKAMFAAHYIRKTEGVSNCEIDPSTYEVRATRHIAKNEELLLKFTSISHYIQESHM